MERKLAHAMSTMIANSEKGFYVMNIQWYSLVLIVKVGSIPISGRDTSISRRI